jgi:predicted flavoprotein YhiN
MLFTHFGLSGPAVLNLSEIVAELLEKFPAVPLRIDFARHFSHDKLAAHLRGWQQQHGKKLVRTMLSQHAPEVTISSTSPDQTAFADSPAVDSRTLSIPSRLTEQLLDQAGISREQACSQLNAAQIHALVQLLKSMRFTITATRGFKEAMVTAGGIALSEVDPKTLESKITPNLFVTGEVLDLTGPSGGYNLQLAFSTGHLAGVEAARKLIGA